MSSPFDPIGYARNLIDHGIPVVVARPNRLWTPGSTDTDVIPPPGWNRITAAESDLSRFRPGTDALLMVGGHGLDVVDLDTKTGATIADLPNIEHYGHHRTPSGGYHFAVPSTGIGKGALKSVTGNVIGDYIGGTRSGGSRMLCFLPGSTRPKYPDAGYTVAEAWDVAAALESEPDPMLVGYLLDVCGLSKNGQPAAPAADDAAVKAWRAGHEDRRGCLYGEAALGSIVTEAPDEPGGRHPYFTTAAVRVVELVNGGCLPLAAVDTLEAAFLAAKPGASGEWREIVAWAVANASTVPCTHGPDDLSAGIPDEPGDPYSHGPNMHSEESPEQYPHVSETAETAETAETGPKLWRAAHLKPAEPTRWLVRGHLPLGQVAVLVGDEGIGKSLWWVLIASHITTGLPCPALGIPARDPRDVLLVLTEDSWTADVRPRLEAAGADLDRIVVVAEDDDGSGSPVFPRDMWLIREGAKELDLALVVVDAWLDTVDSGKQVKDPQQARQALHPWRNTAATTGASVLLLAHSNRSDVGSLRDKVGATAALRQKARVLLYAAQPPESQGVMYLGPNKANNSAMGEAIAYKVTIVQARPATEDDPGTIARLAVNGRTGATMEEHYARWRVERRKAEHPSADDRAKAWLLAYIDTHGEDTELGRAVGAKTAQKAAHVDGHNPERLAGIVKSIGGYAGPGGEGAPWIYRVPINSQTQYSQYSQSPQSQRHGED